MKNGKSSKVRRGARVGSGGLQPREERGHEFEMAMQQDAECPEERQPEGGGQASEGHESVRGKGLRVVVDGEGLHGGSLRGGRMVS